MDSSLSSRWWKTTSDTDPALIPGGFAEACFASSAERKADCFGMVGNVGKNLWLMLVNVVGYLWFVVVYTMVDVVR